MKCDKKLLVDSDNSTGTNSSAAFADSETQTNFDSDRSDQLNVHLNVIAGHAHLNALGQGDGAGYVVRT